MLTHRKAPRSTERPSVLSALLVVAFGFAMSPALAATGADTRCDQSVDSQQMPDVRNSNLTLEVVDHGPTESVTPGRLSIDSAVEDGGNAIPSVDDRPRVETLLRRIFDEPQLRTRELAPAEEADERSAPFAVDKSENAEEKASTAPGDDASDMAPRLPGVSGDELLRFKRQMYRTDI
jgi:hypothetical protein